MASRTLGEIFFGTEEDRKRAKIKRSSFADLLKRKG